MKAFLYKISIYLVLPLFLIVIVYAVRLNRVNNEIKSIATSNSVIVLGDSETQRLNPYLFTQKAFNFSAAGEPFIVTYSKLKKIFSVKNYKVNNIVLGASVHNFSSAFELSYDVNSTEGTQTIKKNVFFLDIDDSFFSFKEIISERNFYIGIFENSKINGFYESLKKKPSEDIIDVTLKGHFKKSSNFDSSDYFYQVFYLKKIIELCRKNKVRLYLCSLPLHKYYKENIPKKCMVNLNNILEKYEGFIYLNYLTDDIDSNLMSDGNHLNKEGAFVYSKIISREIEKEQ
jgi:predicted 3-demethylubiquinone-9 3-methyltransferase (glyoxalase superfamily)